MRFYTCAKEGPNKGSSFSIKLEREKYNFYYGRKEYTYIQFMEVFIMKTNKNIIGKIVSWILTAAVMATIMVGAALYMLGFGISIKDGVYKECTSTYDLFTYRYTNLTFDDIVMFEAANDNAILLAAYGYHPSSVEIRG